MQAARRVKWTQEEYLAREQRSLTRNEFLDGEIYAMAGATLRHNVITTNTLAALHGLLRGKPCRAFNSDQRIAVSRTGLSTYADAGVVCGEPLFHDNDKNALVNPTLLVEVLSPSTEAYDRGEKLDHYRAIPSLREVLLIAQDTPSVEHHYRLDTGQWLLTVWDAGAVALATLGGAVPLDDLYDKAHDLEE
ncbi:MAG: Uma2 family endonuclease [Myxococcales bacterium]|nr:Uma2 family endonuclease [Myxococcales bacterium]